MVKSPHIIGFHELLQTSNHIYLVYDYCNGGSLEDKIQLHQRLTEHEALAIFKQILAGMQSVIQKNIIHRDLKPQNILFHNSVIKIVDFGFCKPLK